MAAFYPPNLVLYRVFDVPVAYRLSMWLHHVGAGRGNVCLRSLHRAFHLGKRRGRRVVYALRVSDDSFEPRTILLHHALPPADARNHRALHDGRAGDLAGIVWRFALGFQWTLGHFQIQMWTSGLVVLTGLWRAGFSSRLWGRALSVIVATAWGAAIAALQLGLSWQFAESVRQTKRSTGDLIYYSFPPLHWFELVLPRLIRELRLGPEDPYWFGQQTWGYEAALYVGTIPLIFAFMVIMGRPASRSALLWRVLVPVSFALATMPRWWPQGYVQLLALPGVGYFRVPARYTLLTSFGLAILAGEGFRASISRLRFRLGLAGSLVFGGCAVAAAVLWVNRPDVHLSSLWAGIDRRIPLGSVCLAGRRRGRVGLAIEKATVVGTAGRGEHRAGNSLLHGDDPVGLGGFPPRCTARCSASWSVDRLPD